MQELSEKTEEKLKRMKEWYQECLFELVEARAKHMDVEDPDEYRRVRVQAKKAKKAYEEAKSEAQSLEEE